MAKWGLGLADKSVRGVLIIGRVADGCWCAPADGGAVWMKACNG